MGSDYRIKITSERRTRRNCILEIEVHVQDGEEPFLAIATLYGTELYINLPANPEANDFLAWLNREIGEPVESPVVKCSAQWSESMIGPMKTVT